MPTARVELTRVLDDERETARREHPQAGEDLVAVLIAGGPFVNRVTRRAGLDRAAWLGGAVTVAGLAVYALLGRLGYLPVAAALVLVAIGIRVVDTASQVTSAAGVAVSGTVLALLFTGVITQPDWTAAQSAQFENAVTTGCLLLTTVAAALVCWARFRMRRG